jgi:hypothetical protein
MLINGLSSGDGHFDSGGPSMAQNFSTTVLPIDVVTTSFSPPEIQDKTTKNMKGLPIIRKPISMQSMGKRFIFVSLKNNLS